MASLDELRSTRIHKLELLKQAGMQAYPAKVPRTFSLAEASSKFQEYETNKEVVSLSGRIMAIRGQGAILFFVLDDGTATFQAIVKKDVLSEELFKLITDAVDIGDIMSVTGTFLVTKRGEPSIEVTSWTMASKSLLPLPEKWHGLVDPDEKLRKRYLDFIMDPLARELFYKKAKFWKVTRNFLEEEGFLEVETPTLETTTGGAEATPFKTHHNDFDLDVFMRISIGELWQKRLMAGGFPKTFEIGRAYRNEGSSPEHMQEFTNMEFYWSYADYNDGMTLVTKMYRKLAMEVFGTTKFSYRDHTFDLADEWVKIDYTAEILKQTGVNIGTASESDIKKRLSELKITYEGTNRERLVDTLWKYCRKNIAGPAFLVNHPKLVAPLAKSVVGGEGGVGGMSGDAGEGGEKGDNGLTEGDGGGENSQTVQMFQPIIGGSEIGRGYSELNDPIDQADRFAKQKKLLEGGDTEAMMVDDEFVEMLEHGMPPTCGFGFGERFFAILCNKPLRETQLFPLMKPRG